MMKDEFRVHGIFSENAKQSAFDAMAGDYDDLFTQSAIGRLMRAAVWRRLDASFRPGDHVLELNCGTGADAVYLAQRGVHVLATDLSQAMLDVTLRKVTQAGVSGLVSVERVDIEDLAAWGSSLSFDGVLSNFGGLNCVADDSTELAEVLAGVAQALARLLKPGGRALLCLMGPLAPWEWAWYLRQGQPKKAFRRLRRDGVAWRGLTIRYPSIAAVRRAFAPAFTLQRVSAIGALLPPSYVEPWAARHPRILAWLNRVERRLETTRPLPWLADHYLIEFMKS